MQSVLNRLIYCVTRMSLWASMVRATAPNTAQRLSMEEAGLGLGANRRMSWLHRSGRKMNVWKRMVWCYFVAQYNGVGRLCDMGREHEVLDYETDFKGEAWYERDVLNVPLW